MLASGDYPPSLKQRIAGRFGHLDNAAAAELLARIDTSRLKHLIAAHLSQREQPPRPGARGAGERPLHCDPEWIGVADQAQGFEWREFV